MSRNRTAELVWRKEVYTNPIKRVRNFENMDPVERSRMDRALVDSEVPIKILAKRFRFCHHMMLDRLKELGYTVEKTKDSISQERIRLA